MKVVFDDEALDDLQSILEWIAKDNRPAAERLVARVFDKAERSRSRIYPTSAALGAELG